MLENFGNVMPRISFPSCSPKQNYKVFTIEKTNKMSFSHKWRAEGLYHFQAKSDANIT